eukprot:412632-Amphidinium_carterae.1
MAASMAPWPQVYGHSDRTDSSPTTERIIVKVSGNSICPISFTLNVLKVHMTAKLRAQYVKQCDCTVKVRV